MPPVYTTVKVRVEAKQKLELLQARLRLRGVRASLHEILEKLVELGMMEEEKLLRMLRGEPVNGDEPDPMLLMLDNPIDWGVEDASVRIDETLYGEGLGGVHRHLRVRGS